MFFLYTFTGSMLTFAGILYVAWFNQQFVRGEWNFSIVQLTYAAQQMSFDQQAWVLGALLAGFAVKVPLFPVHTWLPLAHTEAPTAGSVILAGVLLKLGTYGLLRFAMPMCPEAIVAFLEATDFEDAIRNAVSLGGDSDTLTCITGGIAHAFYGEVPDAIAQAVLARLDEPLRQMVEAFCDRYCQPHRFQHP